MTMYLILGTIIAMGLLLYRHVGLIAILFGVFIVWERGGFEWLL